MKKRDQRKKSGLSRFDCTHLRTSEEWKAKLALVEKKDTKRFESHAEEASAQ